jgi:hypothetical protein
MSSVPKPRIPPINLGPLSLVLGINGLILFFLPVLGLPISVFGFVIGLLAIAFDRSRGGIRLRWSLMGGAVSTLALVINLCIAWAPSGYLEPPGVPPPWQRVPDRPYVPPPARTKLET